MDESTRLESSARDGTLAYEYILTISKHHLEEATRLDAATEDIWEMKLHASNAALISPLSKATSFAGVVNGRAVLRGVVMVLATGTIS